MSVVSELLEWTEQALCTGGGDVWFLSGREFQEEIDAAVRVCCRCPVSQQCLAYAMDLEQGLSRSYRFGIWGGLTSSQRYRLACARVKEVA